MSMRGIPDLILPAKAYRRHPDEDGTHRGMLLFIQYAFMPNHLDYCGSEDHGSLYDYWAAQTTDEDLARLLSTFTGALPYLKLIAHSNGITDPFDRRVVEAYWVGNALLDGVDLHRFFNSLIDRFGKQLQGKAREYVTRKVPMGALPHHTFHVFDVHSRVGELDHSLEVMEQCRVSWGRIIEVEPSHFVIRTRPVVLRDGKLALGAPTDRRVLRLVEDRGFTAHAQLGDWISVHWNCACDILSLEQVHRLDRITRHHLQLANLTL